MSRLNVLTQEAGTGKWFPVTSYFPGTAEQLSDARQLVKALKALDLYAKVERTVV